MPWSEPLTATSYDLEKGLRQVEVRDGGRQLVMSVQYKYDEEHSTSVLGEVVAHSKDAGARQRVRAFVLLIRECVRSARAIGIAHAQADVTPEMQPLAEAAADVMENVGSRWHWRGELADLQGKIAAKTETDGRIRDLTPQREAELVDAQDRVRGQGGPL